MNELPVNPDDNTKLNNLNKLFIALILFVSVWTIGLFVYVDQKVDQLPATSVPVASMNFTNGRIIHKYIPTNQVRNTPPVKPSSPAAKPLFEHKETYSVMEIVVINYFYVSGIIVERDGDNYTVLYKDNNHTLQRIIVPRDLLISPTSSLGMNPFSLLRGD